MKILPAFRILALSLLSLGLAAPAKADIYQWTDEKGKTHFGDNKPQDRPAQAFQGGATVSFMGGGAPTAAHAADKVRVFVTQSCPYCKKAKAFLRKRGTPFEELDIEASRSAEAEYKRLGASGVPVILVGKQRMNGFDESGLANLLLNAGR